MPNLSIYLPERVLEEVDLACEGLGRGRWIRRAVEQALEGEPSGQAVSGGQGRSSASKPVGDGATPSSPAPAADFELPKIAKRKP